MRRTFLAALAGALTVLGIAGCGGDGGRADAVAAAEKWMRAVADRDARSACELMDKSAVDAIRVRYSRLGKRAECAAVVRAYRDGFEPGDLEATLKRGLEPEGAVKEGELGVFPATGPRELQVVLMARRAEKWKVISTTIDPRGAPTPDERTTD